MAATGALHDGECCPSPASRPPASSTGGTNALSVFDLEAFDREPLRHDPCDFIVVPRFVKRDALEAINRDYPDIAVAGNFEPEKLTYGPSFAGLLAELNGPEFTRKFSEKFGIDLSELPLQMTVRKYSEKSDGNVHNDSKGKIVTALIYFNQEWRHEGGRLRIVRTPNNIDDYAAEAAPEGGTLLAFRRSERSFHGFKPFVGERRSLQMYWVKPKRVEVLSKGEKRVGIKKMVKRFLKLRPR
jgi:SM-20-related protein